MLASRGFVYHSEESASHGRHIGCDCVVLPGVPGKTKVDGYDEKGMRDRWARCQKAAGVKDGDTWKNRKKILKEAATRDREWLLTGTCKATRIAANPAALKTKELHPEIYADWQDAVSRVLAPSTRTKNSQRKHIYGTDEFKRPKERPSYFVKDDGKTPLTDKDINELRDKVNTLAGTGFPDLDHKKKGKSSESIPHCGLNAIDGRRDAPVDGIVKLHYGMGAKRVLHAVPMWSGSDSDD